MSEVMAGEDYYANCRSEFEKIEKGYFFDNLRLELETKGIIQPQLHNLFQAELTKLVKENKTEMYKVEKKNLKKEVYELIADKRASKANEVVSKFIEKWYNIKSIRDDNYREMYIYKNGIYTENAQSYIKEVCRYCLDTIYSDFFATKVINKIEVDTYIDYDKFVEIKDPYEIAVQNGILNIKTGKLTNFTPEKVFFNKINAFYDPNAICPNFEKFLLSILTESDKEQNKLMIEELIGFCLVREYFQEKAFLFQGNGRNGKGKLINVIETLLGADNVCNLPLEEIKYDGFQLCNLANKLVNIGGDIGKSRLKATQAFKGATGWDTLTANRKGKSYINFKNYAKMIFCANELPETCDDSDGFFDRWEFVDFPYKFVSQEELESATDEEKKFFKLRDPSIIKTLTTDNEINGVLILAIKGLKRLLENKTFTGNQTSTEIKEKWQARNASFESFASKHIESADGDIMAYIEIGALKKEYEIFCLKNRAKRQQNKDVEKIMFDKYGTGKDIKNVDGKTKRVYPYVKFKELEHQKNMYKTGDKN